MKEYIFHTPDEAVLRAFFDNFKPFEIDGFSFYIITGEVVSVERAYWVANVYKEDSKDIYCRISNYPIPNGFVVNFDWRERRNEELANRIVEKVLSKAKLLGFEPLELTDALKISPTQEIKERDGNAQGMKEWRLRRANLFKEIKDKEPSLSKQRLALKARQIELERIRSLVREQNPRWGSDQVEQEVQAEFKRLYHDDSEFTEDDVKNDYRDMGWEWEDSRKIT